MPGNSLTPVLLTPWWLIHGAVAAVWLYEGLWCKLLKGDPRQLQIMQAVPGYGARFGAIFLKLLGILETGLALWILTGVAPLFCATVQTALLISLNTGGLIWSRHLIHDPAGMVIKNLAFLVLVWVSASFPGWK